MVRESKAAWSRGRSAAMLVILAIFALMPVRGASANMLQIIPQGPTVLNPGDSITFSVQFTATQSFVLQANDIAIAYDSTRFMISTTNPNPVTVGTLNSNFSQFVGTPDSGVAGIGEITTSAFANNAGNQITANQTGTLLTFTLTALANAPTGGAVGDINLQANFGNTTTDVFGDANGNALVLTPAPTNGLDLNVDATALIGGGAVPEPSSLVLMGLSGGLISLATFLRRKGRRPAPAR